MVGLYVEITGNEQSKIFISKTFSNILNSPTHLTLVQDILFSFSISFHTLKNLSSGINGTTLNYMVTKVFKTWDMLLISLSFETKKFEMILEKKTCFACALLDHFSCTNRYIYIHAFDICLGLAQPFMFPSLHNCPNVFVNNFTTKSNNRKPT